MDDPAAVPQPGDPHARPGNHPKEDTVDDFVLRVLDVIGRADMHDSLYWRTDGQFAPVTFFVDCSDLFAWACADAEPVTPETLPELARALADAQEADGSATWGPSLYAARQRKQRPMAKAYPGNEALRVLFDACGPERSRD